jgi:conjugal transfer pilus assembly protein TraK
MYSTFKKWSSLILCGLAASNQADATQLIENSDKQSIQVNISVRETNRLAVEGRRITNVVPAQPGLISAKKDEAQGALYFTMTGEPSAVGTVSMFVSDDQNATYKLILVPRPIPGEEIILRPTTEKGSAAGKTGATDGRAASYQRRIKDLILMMSDDELQDGLVDKVDINKEVPLWQEGRLIVTTKFLESDLVGEKYRLTNVSRTDMLLVEQELFRRGVRAVSIKSQTLAPGDSTDIYIVRERKDNE